MLSAAQAETLSIPGPAGALQGEALIVPGAKAGVMIIPGSGPIDRDGNMPMAKTDTYRLLADGLAGAGISSLRIDKRGFGGSETAIADQADITIATYAQDARDWAATFAAKIGTDCVWIAGHSEGGLVALVAAAEQAKAGQAKAGQAQAGGGRICGLVLMAAPGRKVSDLMRMQFRQNPYNAPVLDELDGIVGSLERGEYRDEEKITPAIRPLFSKGLQRYMMQLFTYDPVEVAKGVTLPVLILQGDRDMQVKSEDAALLAKALPQARSVPLPGVTHMLKADVPGNPFATYQDPKLPLDPALVPAIVDFIGSHHGK
ncbi:alpha/beta hydrolase [Azorhizobium oxalatiphilum]|uniref:Alpha/beta hydrolase n=1 Tax=Azorhizobium oxalatiphilum TaxID=980631 RepID=A0A917F2A9_9HYPH|nr:alpha/beta hydrolase [Azorhizobium oxalatiphilum]